MAISALWDGLHVSHFTHAFHSSFHGFTFIQSAALGVPPCGLRTPASGVVCVLRVVGWSLHSRGLPPRGAWSRTVETADRTCRVPSRARGAPTPAPQRGRPTFGHTELRPCGETPHGGAQPGAAVAAAITGPHTLHKRPAVTYTTPHTTAEGLRRHGRLIRNTVAPEIHSLLSHHTCTTHREHTYLGRYTNLGTAGVHQLTRLSLCSASRCSPMASAPRLGCSLMASPHPTGALTGQPWHHHCQRGRRRGPPCPVRAARPRCPAPWRSPPSEPRSLAHGLRAPCCDSCSSRAPL